MGISYLPFWIFVSVMFAGCSTHPIQDTATDLKLTQIVDKVRCEAKTVVDDLHAQNGFLAKQQGLDDFDVGLEKKSKKLAKFRRDNGLDFSIEDLETQRRKLRYEKRQLASELQTKLDANPESSQTLDKRFLEILTSSAQIDKKLKAIDDYELEAAKYSVAEQERLSRYAELVKFNEHFMVHNFRFKISENNDATSKGTIAWPINIGVVSLGYDVGDKKQRVAERNVKLIASFREIRETKNCVPITSSSSYTYPIAGELGLHEVVSQYWEIVNKSRLSAKGESYQDRIEFTTTINGSVTPKIVMAPVRSPNVTAEATLAATRTDVHELTIYLAPAPAGDRPTTISIARIPDLNVNINQGQPEYAAPVVVQQREAAGPSKD